MKFAILVFSIFLVSCDPYTETEEYYKNNQRLTREIYESYKPVEKLLPIKNLRLKNYHPGNYLFVNLSVSQNQMLTFRIDRKNCEVLFDPPPSYPSDSLILKNYSAIVDILGSDLFKRFAGNVIKSKYKGVEASQSHFFITLGSPGKKSKHPDMQTGLMFVADPQSLNSNFLTKELDEGIYVYESVIP